MFKKVSYYRSKVSRDRCIEHYFQEVYLPWVRAAEHEKTLVEKKYMGVHEFKPQFRGPCFTVKFEGRHPESVQKDVTSLKARLLFELKLLEQSFASFEKYCSRYKQETT